MSEVSRDFCSELHALLMADDEAACRRLLLRAAGARKAAGVALFGAVPSHDLRSSTHFQWAEDLSGELDGISGLEFAPSVLATTPEWLHRWMLGRRQPFWLHRYARYIPFSRHALLRASAPPGRRGLGDMIVVPLRHGEIRFGLFMGLFEPARSTQRRELFTLASAYLVKQAPAFAASLADDKTPARAELNERQLQCLQWIVAGKSLEEVATITGMSYANVRYHLDRAKKLTGFKSLQQLLAYAAVEYRLSPLGPPGEAAAPIERTIS